MALKFTNFMFLLLLLPAANVWGASATSNVTVNAGVAARATLIISAATVNFPDADPETVPSIGATENPVTITAKVRTGSAGTPSLTVIAGGDLTSGTDLITINKITWTATGAGYQGGTMNKTTAQTVGSWTGPGVNTGTNSFFLANSWLYATGNYTVNVTYTLSAP